MVQILFINLSGLELGTIVLLSLAVVVFAVIKILRRESGIPQLLWLLSVVLVPPFLGMIYLLKIMVFEKSYKIVKG